MCIGVGARHPYDPTVGVCPRRTDIYLARNPRALDHPAKLGITHLSWQSESFSRRERHPRLQSARSEAKDEWVILYMRLW